MGRLGLSFTLILFLAQCTPQIVVHTDHDPDYLIANRQTFDWGNKADIESLGNPLYYNELNDKRIKTAILHELSNRGYRQSDTNPTMLIHYHIIVNDRSVITTDPYGYFYGPYWLHLRTNQYTYREGTLIIDLMDPTSNNLIWRGWATAALDQIDAGNVDEAISLAVSKLFRRFPDAVYPPAKAANGQLHE